MAKQMSGRPSKKRLTKEEIKRVEEWLDNAPQGRKPSIRQIARALGRTRPAILKSLGGWRGIQRGRPEPATKPLIPKPEIREDIRPKVEPFTIQLPEGLNEKATES